jgi:hypothetical protein
MIRLPVAAASAAAALLLLLLAAQVSAAAAAAASAPAPTSGPLPPPPPSPPSPPSPLLLLDAVPSGVVPPGQDVVVTASPSAAAAGDGGPPPALLWRLNFGEEQEVPFSPSGSATIPLAASAAKDGDLLRWRLRAAPGVFDPPERDPPAPFLGSPAPPPGTPSPPPPRQPRERYAGALVSASPSARVPQPRPLEPSPYSAQNLLDLASPGIPEIHVWAPNEQAAISDAGIPGCVVYLPPVSADGGGARGQVYDAVRVERRGVTALAWRKPKLKISLVDGASTPSPSPSPPSPPPRFLVSYAPEKGTRSLKINSYHAELGDGPSMLREAVALAVLRESGVAAPLTFYVRLFLNGRPLGLFGVVEDVDPGFLERRGLPSSSAPIFESVSGEMSNLRGDLPASELDAFYGKTGDPASKSDWAQLELFTRGLAGAGAPGDTGGNGNGGSSSSSSSSSSADGSPPLLSRTRFLLDSVNLPSAVNEAAAQTVLGNMDRCTKNFYVYRDPRTLQWQRFPWDVEASFGQDNGLGGKPGDLYAVLAGEQWSSPLYCDAQHPQDLDAAGRPGLNTYFGSARGSARDALKAGAGGGGGAPPAVGAAAGSSGGRRRRLHQQQQQQQQQQHQQRLLAEGPPLQAGGWPEPAGWADPDAVPPGLGLVRLGSPAGAPLPRRGSGAAYTYNHLTAALLDVPETRAMYLRRLRTLADIYYGNGGGGGQQQQQQQQQQQPPEPRIALLVRAAWAKISAAAQEDARLWARADPARGVQQVLTEYVPIRARQLLETYAPGGVRPLLPAAASPTASLRLARFDADAGSFLEVRNDAAAGPDGAVDASGWEVRWSDGGGGGGGTGGGATTAATWRLPPGFVVPPGRSVFVVRGGDGGGGGSFRARATSPRAGEGNVFVPVFPPAPGVVGGPPGAVVGPEVLPAAGRWELVDRAGRTVSAL